MTWKRRSALATLFLLLALVVAGIMHQRLLAIWFDSVVTVPVPERLTLLSIDGTHGPGKAPPNAEQFHEYPVLGKLEITEAEQRKAIMTAIERGIWTAKYGRGGGCFWPRHGIRIERDGELLDYVICFQCHNLEVYSGSVQDHGAATTENAKGLLNRLLVDAGIPLAPEGR